MYWRDAFCIVGVAGTGMMFLWFLSLFIAYAAAILYERAVSPQRFEACGTSELSCMLVGALCVVLCDAPPAHPFPSLLATVFEGRWHGTVVGVHEGRPSVPQDRQGSSESARGRRAAQGFWVGAA